MYFLMYLKNLAVLQHQPVSDQYEVKRENFKHSAVGNDNPFLRRPRTLQIAVKTIPTSNQRHDIDAVTAHDDDEGRKGWIPIPYPIQSRR